MIGRRERNWLVVPILLRPVNDRALRTADGDEVAPGPPIATVTDLLLLLLLLGEVAALRHRNLLLGL